ncbi:MAG: hypothetical protein CSA58_10645 [Micrococcales bacterium]|nr:MAG: hypothetical protein CSB46_08415 [Micrococcales bacterium]PIE26219.1 MAG: hypothetical protein CSA58_10645 [Micrococcales bacterium]
MRTTIELTDESHRAVVERLCANRTLPLGVGAARAAGAVSCQLWAAGQPIGPADSLIAGVCLHHGMPLLTKNPKHFSRVPGLQVNTP